jgi:hypothetical protein
MNINCEIKDDIILIGTKVYIPRPVFGTVDEDEVIGYYGVLTKEGEQYVLTPTDYVLNTINLDKEGLNSGWKASQFFLSYDEAKAQAVEYLVDASQTEWFKAIGLNQDSDRLYYDENCELAPCCNTISNIRNILFDVCKEGCITGVARLELIELLESHECCEPKPILDSLLRQLKIKWNDKAPFVELL